MCKGPLGGHCWHSQFNGFYQGYQPSDICCFCGTYKEDQHGPYNPNNRPQNNPWGGMGGSGAIGGMPSYQSFQNGSYESQQEYFGGGTRDFGGSSFSCISSGTNPGGLGGRASEGALH